jgi:hypothetical protein
VDRERLRQRLRDAGIEDGSAPAVRSRPLAAAVNGVLAAAGVSLAQQEKVAHALRKVPRTSAAAGALGSGFGAWTLTHSDQTLHHAVENGAEIGDFIVDNLDVLTAGWDVATPAIASFLVEFTLRLPDGTVELGSKVLRLLERSDEVGDAVSLNLVDGVGLDQALELAGVGADVADVVDGITTFGLGILLGWAAKKAVETAYEPQIRARMDRLNALRTRYAQTAKLREMLRTELPAAVIAGQLNRVDASHRAF